MLCQFLLYNKVNQLYVYINIHTYIYVDPPLGPPSYPPQSSKFSLSNHRLLSSGGRKHTQQRSLESQEVRKVGFEFCLPLMGKFRRKGNKIELIALWKIPVYREGILHAFSHSALTITWEGARHPFLLLTKVKQPGGHRAQTFLTKSRIHFILPCSGFFFDVQKLAFG